MEVVYYYKLYIGHCCAQAGKYNKKRESSGDPVINDPWQTIIARLLGFHIHSFFFLSIFYEFLCNKTLKSYHYPILVANWLCIGFAMTKIEKNIWKRREKATKREWRRKVWKGKMPISQRRIQFRKGKLDGKCAIYDFLDGDYQDIKVYLYYYINQLRIG
jgi:hypothetical protein